MAITIGGSNFGIAGLSATCATGVFGTQPTSGSTIAVLIRWTGFGDVSSVADNSGSNTYTAVTTKVTDGGSSNNAQIWYAYNITTAASFVVTATMSGSSEEEIMVVAVELKDALTTDPLDVFGGQVQTTPATTTDAVSTGALSTCSVDGCAVVALSTCPTIVDVWDAGTNYTELYEETTTNSHEVHIEYRIQTTAAAATATSTQDNGTINFVTVAAAFKPAGGGGGSIGVDDSHGGIFLSKQRHGPSVRLF